MVVAVALYLGANLLGAAAGEGLGSIFDYLRRRRDVRRAPISTFRTKMPSKDVFAAIQEAARQADARIAMSGRRGGRTTLDLPSGGQAAMSFTRQSDGEVLIRIDPGQPAPVESPELARLSGFLLASLRRRDSTAQQIQRSRAL